MKNKHKLCPDLGQVMNNSYWPRMKRPSGWPLPFGSQAPELFEGLLILVHLLLSAQTPRQLRLLNH